MIDTQEIVIHSQKELDKLFDDNYHAGKNIAFIDKNLKFDSSRTTYWKKGKASFKYAIECKNINAGLMRIESSSNITAHDIAAWKIDCANIRAHDIDCPDLKAKTVYADAIKARHIYSNYVWINNRPTRFYNYDY